jgi:hypothetical protein
VQEVAQSLGSFLVRVKRVERVELATARER